jgi:hypothetical protein
VKRKDFDAPRFARFLGALVVPERTVGQLDGALRALGKQRAMTQQRSEKAGVLRPRLAKCLRGDHAALPAFVFDIGQALRTLDVSWCSGFVALGEAGYVAERIALQEAMDRQDPERGAILWGATVAESHLDDESDRHRAVARDTLSKCWAEIGDESLERAWATASRVSFRPRNTVATLLAIYEGDDYNDEAEQQEDFDVLFEAWKRRHPLVPHVVQMVEQCFSWEEDLRWMLAQQEAPKAPRLARRRALAVV